MPDSPGQVDFAVRLVNFILHLPDRQVEVLGEFVFQEIKVIPQFCIAHLYCAEFYA